MTSSSLNAESSPLRYTFKAPSTRSRASSGTHTNASGSSGVPATTLDSGSCTTFGTLRVSRFSTTQPVTPVPSGIGFSSTSSTQPPTANTGRSNAAGSSIS